MDTEEIFASERKVFYKTIEIDGLDIHYRESGSVNSPAIILLHGFPTSSHMFRDLIPELSDIFRVIAPDYPGFGYSSMPPVNRFDYTFENLALVISKLLNKLGIETYSLYVQDYGGPVGFRIAVKNPERIEALIVQNANAYEEGLRDFWNQLKAYWKDRSPDNAEPLKNFLTPEAVKWQFTHGVRNVEAISPDNWHHVQPLLKRSGNEDIQLQLFYDYRSNLSQYPLWQEYLRERQPPTLVVWGKNDHIFPAEGAYPYNRDLKNIDFHLLDTGHFALEEDLFEIVRHIRRFTAKNGII